jgi:hypothetical protein
MTDGVEKGLGVGRAILIQERHITKKIDPENVFEKLHAQQFAASGLPNKARGTLRSPSRCAFLPARPDKSSSGQQMRG